MLITKQTNGIKNINLSRSIVTGPDLQKKIKYNAETLISSIKIVK